MKEQDCGYDTELAKLLCEDVAFPTQVSTVRLDDQEARQALDFIKSYQGDPQWLPWEVLIRLARINKGILAVPFLHDDNLFDIPGFKFRVRFNHCMGVTSDDIKRDPAYGDTYRQFQEFQPQIPMVVCNAVDGIPLKEKCVDLFILNHGISMAELSLYYGFNTHRERNRYLECVQRVTKPGGLIVYYDHNHLGMGIHGGINIDCLCLMLRTSILKFDLPDKILGSLMTRTRKIRGISCFEDFFTNPDLQSKATFLRKLKCVRL